MLVCTGTYWYEHGWCRGGSELPGQCRAGSELAWAGDVMAGGGGAAGPAPTIHHQPQGAQSRRITVILYIGIRSCIACIPAFRCEPHSEGVTSANSMQEIAGSRPVCNFFELIQHGMYAYVLVYTCLYWYEIPIRLNLSVYTSIYWYVVVQTVA